MPAAIEEIGEFAVLGFARSANSAQGGGDLRDVSETFDGTRFRYTADRRHELLLPDFQWLTLGTGFYEGNDFSRQTIREPAGAKSIDLLLSIPSAPSLTLSYTGFGWWYLNALIAPSPGRQLNQSGTFAYGVATTATGMPTSGSVRYVGYMDFEGYGTKSPVDVTVDFAARSVSGSLTINFTEFGGEIIKIGTYAFTSPLPSGATAAAISVPLDESRTGTLEIQFTGPAAQEAMLRMRGVVPCLFVNGGTCEARGTGAARQTKGG